MCTQIHNWLVVQECLYVVLLLIKCSISFTCSAPGPVTITGVNWFNATHVSVMWIPLTLEEARGFVTRYTVRAVPANSQARNELLKTFPKEASSGTMAGLEPAAEYLVSVFASNEEEEGTTNAPMHLGNIPFSNKSQC